MKSLVYRWTRVVVRLFGVLLLRIRCEGRHHLPAEGGVLVCPNHQSFLDPVLVGLACDRELNFLARKTLFRFAPFRWLIETYNAIPLDRERGGLSGIRETLKRLRAGQLVLIFPEGTRSRDGQINPLKPGFCVLARKGKSPLMPVGIAGAFEAWPRGLRIPRLARIRVVFGEPISPQESAELNDEQLVAELERRIRSCWKQASQMP